MEHVIKIPSQQSAFSPLNNLADLVIPGSSGIYDLSQTYIAFDTSLKNPSWVAPANGQMGAGLLTQEDAVADMRLNFQHGTNSMYNLTACPIELLVRDCSIFSANRGKIEDVRRSDVLRGTRASYLNDINDVQAKALTGTAGMAKTAPWASGMHAQLYGVGDVVSNKRRHELRIYLKDIFNFCQAEAYDSSIYGALTIHLELNFDRLIPVQNPLTFAWSSYYHNFLQNGGPPPTNPPLQGPVVQYGEARGLTIETLATPLNVTQLIMQAEYDCIEDHPFWVGQSLDISTLITGDGTGGAPSPASGDVNWAVVSSIDWDKNTKLVTLGFGGTIFSLQPVTGNLRIEWSVAGSRVDTTTDEVQSAITYESCELTAVRRMDLQSGPPQIQYTQYQQQADQFATTANANATLNRSYFLPANTTNCIICLPVSGGGYNSDLLGCARVSDYRFTIDGEAVTNRAVPYMPLADFTTAAPDAKGDAGSSIHYDLISKTFQNQGLRYHSLLEAVASQTIPYSTGRPSAGGVVGLVDLRDDPEKRVFMLALPIPLKNSQTQLTIELNAFYDGANAGQIFIYSEVQSAV